MWPEYAVEKHADPEGNHIVGTDAEILAYKLERSAFVDVWVVELENKGDRLRESQ